MPYIARESFAAPDNRLVLKGAELADDDPVVKGREHLFDRTDAPRPTGPRAFGPDEPVAAPAPRRGRRAKVEAEAEETVQ